MFSSDIKRKRRGGGLNYRTRTQPEQPLYIRVTIPLNTPMFIRNFKIKKNKRSMGHIAHLRTSSISIETVESR